MLHKPELTFNYSSIGLVTLFLAHALGRPFEELEPYLSYSPSLLHVLTLRGNCDEGLVDIFYAMVWIDPKHQFIQYMYQGDSYRFDREELMTILREQPSIVSLQ